MSRVFVIAEAGVNHNGSLQMAHQMVDAAVAAGADAIKFQTFISSELAIRSAEKAGYQQQTTDTEENQFDMLRGLELSQNAFQKLCKYCHKQNITFLTTAFDFSSLDFLLKNLKLKTLKIPSGEITNGPFLLAHARSERRLIVSTGMASLGEIERALGVLAFGMLGKNQEPSSEAFEQAYSSLGGQQALRKNVVLLQCTTDYPAPPEAMNLKAIRTLAGTFGLSVGLSDHSEGITASIAAAALGAVIIEKHFTLDRQLPGPDHKASLIPAELEAMVKGIREVELMLGSGVKSPHARELANRDVARKSIVAACPIRKGDLITSDKLAIKRPAIGRSPMDYWELEGTVASCDYATDEAIL